MTDAPKIDTQAPERLTIQWGGDGPMNISIDEPSTWDMKAAPATVEFIRRDLADARAAAAYRQGLHDGIDKAANRYRVCASPDVWDYFYTAHNAMLDLKAFEFPAPDGQAALDRLIAERVREATADLRGLLWFAWSEFNAILARSGAPLTRDGMLTCHEEWWEAMTEAFADAIGPDAKTPWPSKEAKAVTAKIAARGSKEEKP